MRIAPLPANEVTRLERLHELRILDTEKEDSFDNITALTKHIFNVSVVLISLVDENRQWFKSKQGLDDKQTGRDESFCSHVVAAGQPLIIEDARKDERFADNPLVTKPDDPVIFYAGMPLIIDSDIVIGTLCIIDSEPRELSEHEVATLKRLSRVVINQIYHRQTALALSEEHELFSAGPVATFKLNLRTLADCKQWVVQSMSDNIGLILKDKNLTFKTVNDLIRLIFKPDRKAFIDNLNKHEKDGLLSIQADNRCRTPKGNQAWLQLITRAEFDNYGRVFAIRGYLIEQSRRKKLELKFKQYAVELHARNHQLKQSVQQLQKSRERLRKSYEMASWGLMSNVFWEDVKRPFGSIAHNIGLLREAVNNHTTDANVSHIFESCDTETSRVRELIERLNVGSVMDNCDDEQSQHELGEIIESVRSSLGGLCLSPPDVILVSGESFSVMAEKSQLHQCLLNILLDARLGASAKAKVSVNVKAKNELVVTRLSYAYDYAQSTKNSSDLEPFEKHNLAIAIAEEIIESQNGKLHLADSHENSLRTVTLTLRGAVKTDLHQEA